MSTSMEPGARVAHRRRVPPAAVWPQGLSPRGNFADPKVAMLLAGMIALIGLFISLHLGA